MARNDIKNSSLLKTKFLIYAFNGRTLKVGNLGLKKYGLATNLERQNGAKRGFSS